MDVVEEIHDKIKSAVIEQLKYKKEIALAQSYYKGAQWDPSIKTILEMEGKPALVYNYILRTTEFLLGLFRKIKFRERFLPKNPQSIELADVATEVIRYIYEANSMNKIFPKVFRELVLFGQSFLRVYVDYLENPGGEIKIRSCDPKLVFWDPNSINDDLGDANFVFEIFYVDKDELIANYPKHKEEIEATQTVAKFILGEPIPIAIGGSLTPITADYGHWDSQFYRTPVIISPNKIEVALYEERFVDNEHFIYDTKDKVYYRIPNEKSFKVTELRNYVANLNDQIGEYRFELQNKKSIKLRQVVLLPESKIVLDEVINPWDINQFTIVPFFAFTVDNEKFGIYRILKDPQDEINKKKSLAMQILKEAPQNKWFINKTSILDEEELEDLEDAIDNPDIHFIPINMIQGAPTPAVTDAVQKINAILNLELRSELQLKDLAGVTDAIMGIIPRKIQSGKAIQRLQEASLIYFENFLDSFRESRKILAKLVYKIAQKVLPNNMVIRIANEQTGEIDFRRLNVVLGDKNILTLANTDFDIVVDFVEDSPTLRLEYLGYLSRLAELGMPIPPELLVEYLGVPAHLRRRIFEFYQQMSKLKENQNNTEE